MQILSISGNVDRRASSTVLHRWNRAAIKRLLPTRGQRNSLAKLKPARSYPTILPQAICHFSSTIPFRPLSTYDDAKSLSSIPFRIIDGWMEKPKFMGHGRYFRGGGGIGVKLGGLFGLSALCLSLSNFPQIHRTNPINSQVCPKSKHLSS